MTDSNDALIKQGLSDARALEPTDNEVDIVMSRLAEPRRKAAFSTHPGSMWILLLAVALALGGSLAVPSVRAAVDQVGEEFGEFFGGFFGSGSDSEPGQPLSQAELESGDLPPWLTHGDVQGQRVIATEQDHGLYLRSSAAGYIDFSLDNALSFGDTAEGWSRQLAGKTLVTLAPLEDGDEVALFGLSAGGVDSVRVRYEDGGRVAADSSAGGFIAMVDPVRRPTAIEALDGRGDVIATEDLSHITWGSLDG